MFKEYTCIVYMYWFNVLVHSAPVLDGLSSVKLSESSNDSSPAQLITTEHVQLKTDQCLLTSDAPESIPESLKKVGQITLFVYCTIMPGLV